LVEKKSLKKPSFGSDLPTSDNELRKGLRVGMIVRSPTGIRQPDTLHFKTLAIPGCHPYIHRKFGG
jgi:hypothetical protein